MSVITIQLLGLTLQLDEHVYEPAEDSLLLARNLEASSEVSALDLCTGTGLAALLLARKGAQTVATDLNPVACRLARTNARANALDVHVVCTDLSQGLEHAFDIVVCNPPYLPTGPEDEVEGIVNRALAGGPDGAGVARRVIQALPDLLDRGGYGLLVTSSLQPVENLASLAGSHGLGWTVIDQEPLGMERLDLVRLERNR